MKYAVGDRFLFRNYTIAAGASDALVTIIGVTGDTFDRRYVLAVINGRCNEIRKETFSVNSFDRIRPLSATGINTCSRMLDKIETENEFNEIKDNILAECMDFVDFCSNHKGT